MSFGLGMAPTGLSSARKNADYERAEIQSGVNWRLHLDMDAVVLRRASDDSLPDSRVIAEFERRGGSQAAAVHRIRALVAGELWERMKEACEARGGSKELSTDPEWSEMRNNRLNDRIEALVAAPSESRNKPYIGQ